jgi:transposase-like protein
MGTKDKERRVDTREFKAEAVALAEKHERPVSQVAADLGINENMPRRWMRRAREGREAQVSRPSPDTDGRGTKNWPGRGRKSRRYGRRCEAPRFTRNPKYNQ